MIFVYRVYSCQDEVDSSAFAFGLGVIYRALKLGATQLPSTFYRIHSPVISIVIFVDNNHDCRFQWLDLSSVFERILMNGPQRLRRIPAH